MVNFLAYIKPTTQNENFTVVSSSMYCICIYTVQSFNVYVFFCSIKWGVFVFILLLEKCQPKSQSEKKKKKCIWKYVYAMEYEKIVEAFEYVRYFSLTFSSHKCAH